VPVVVVPRRLGLSLPRTADHKAPASPTYLRFSLILCINIRASTTVSSAAGLWTQCTGGLTINHLRGVIVKSFTLRQYRYIYIMFRYTSFLVATAVTAVTAVAAATAVTAD